MAKLDYAKLQGRVSKLMPKVAQGSVILKRQEQIGSGPNPWDPPVTIDTFYRLSASVKRVDQRYEGGVLIVETVDIVTFDATAVQVDENGNPAGQPAPIAVVTIDKLIIDGRERVITSLKPTPSAGTVVAWRAVVAV